MRSASEIRFLARNALSGNWTVAVLAGIVAGIFGVSDTSNFNLNINLNVNGFGNMMKHFAMDLPVMEFLSVFITFVLVIAIVLAVVGCAVGVGYSKFNLDITDGKKPSFDTLFAYFPNLTNLVVTKLLQTLYIILWTLLLIIPGIIKSFSYAMTSFILAENPELPPKEAINLSKEMMRGNRLRLFLLSLSFIGWILLSVLTFGIGLLWVTPYMNAAMASFYREVSGTFGYNEETVYYDI